MGSSIETSGEYILLVSEPYTLWVRPTGKIITAFILAVHFTRFHYAVGEFWHGHAQQALGANWAKAERRVWAFGTPANHASSLTTFIATAVMTCCRWVFAIPT